jgi:hypothetical protein
MKNTSDNEASPLFAVGMLSSGALCNDVEQKRAFNIEERLRGV